MANSKLSALTARGTPDRTNDLLYVVNAGVQYKSTPNNLLGISGNPVGDTDSQTLTNKTLTSPTISNPTLSGTLSGTYIIGGTPTFPASVVTLTGSQTLTNKVLTSPTISAPTITNASITADAVTGFTSANNGTIYGISVTSGVITSAAVGSSSIVTGAQIIDKTKNPYKFSVYRNAALSVAGSTDVKVTYDTRTYDTGSNFDIATNNRFTAPIAGFYHFDASVTVPGTTNSTARLTLYVNNIVNKIGNQIYSSTTGTVLIPHMSVDVQLSLNDYVEIFVQQNTANPQALTVGSTNCWFTGHLISAT